jgi:hypothetical protein
VWCCGYRMCLHARFIHFTVSNSLSLCGKLCKTAPFTCSVTKGYVDNATCSLWLPYSSGGVHKRAFVPKMYMLHNSDLVGCTCIPWRLMHIMTPLTGTCMCCSTQPVTNHDHPAILTKASDVRWLARHFVQAAIQQPISVSARPIDERGPCATVKYTCHTLCGNSKHHLPHDASPLWLNGFAILPRLHFCGHTSAACWCVGKVLCMCSKWSHSFL